MTDWWFWCVVGTFCLIPLPFQRVVAERNFDATEQYLPMEQTEKCGFWTRLLNKCPKKVIIVTTPTPVSDDASVKSLGFSFSAFVITLFASLAIALTGAFACWCCRAFCRNHISSSSTHPVYNNEGVALESLVGDQMHVQRDSYRRQNSLPTYMNAVHVSNDTISPVPSAPIEDPPPSYASLYDTRK